MKKNHINTCLIFLLFLPLHLIAQKSELFLAVEAQDVPKVKEVLTKSVNIEEKSEVGFTPLILGMRGK